MSTLPPSSQKKLFLLCFSPKDAQGKAELVAHLSPVRGALTIWSVDEVSGGGSILAAFQEVVADADAALLLLSSDFFAELDKPPFAEQVERLRGLHKERGLPLIPLLWRHCDWQAVDWLAALKPLPVDRAAIAPMAKAQRDRAFAEIARQLDGRSLLQEASGAIEPFQWPKAWSLLAAVVLGGAIVAAADLAPRASDRKSAPPSVAGVVLDFAAAPILWKVEGRVRDGRLDPLAGVSVSLPEFFAVSLTNADGYFRFAVPADHDGLVLLRAEKRAAAGSRRKYRPHEVHVNLGSTKLDIVLEDTP